jgi:hypothetical protein
VDEPRGLLGDGGDDRGMAMADVGDADAGEEVEVLRAVLVPQLRPSPRANATGKRA